MTFELWIVLAATLLGLVHITAASFTFKAQVGNKYTAGPSDEGIQAVGMVGRMQRALYASGIPWLRTFNWNLATLGLVLVGVQLLIEP